MDGDLTLSVRLKADGSGFVGAVKLSRQELDKFGKGAVESERGARRLGDGMEAARSRALLLKTAIVALVTGGTARLAKSFIDAADESEGYRLRLVRLLRDQGEANRLFTEAAAIAARLPFEFREVMGSATALAGVLRGGADEVASFLPLIGDLAAVTGLSFQQTTEQVVRMVSAGAASADLFRERGVLAMLGFQSGVTVSARETREQLFREWNKADSQFKGAAGDLAATWTGLMSMFGDKWFAFRNQVMDAGLFDFLKSNAAELLDRIDESGKGIEDFATRLGHGIEEAIKGTIIGAGDALDVVTPVMQVLQDGINTAIAGYNNLPLIVREVGLFGVLFFGRKFALVGALALGVIEDFERRRKEALDRATRDLQNQQQNGVTIDLDTGREIDPRAPSSFTSLFDMINKIGVGDGKKLDELSFGGGPRSKFGDQFRGFFGASGLRRTNEVDALDQEFGAMLREMSGGTARAAAEQPKAAVDFINKGMLDLIPAYDRAIIEAKRWREEALRGLDEAGEGYDDFAADIDFIFNDLMVQAYETGLRASKKWEDGVERAFLDYRRNAADMASQAERLVTGSFERMEDGIVKFVRTGKFEFGDLADFIIDELIRIQVRKQIVGIFGDLDLGGIIGDLFSGQGGDVTPTIGNASGGAAVAHSGGVIGADRLPSRSVSAGVFAGAPRFHSGGIVGGEVPIIARRGEGVFTPAQMAAMGAGGGGRGGEVNVTVVNNSGAPASVSQQAGARGGRDITVMIGEALARDVRNRGPLGKAIEDTFGASRTLAGR